MIKKYSQYFLGTLLFLMPYSVLIAQESANDQSTTAKTKALLRSIDQFNHHFKTAKAHMLDSMLVENYKHTNGSSPPYNKKVWLDYIISRKTKIDSGELFIEAYGMTETSITFYDQVALVNGIVFSKGTENGMPFDKKFRVTHLWVLENNQWKRAGFHDGVID